MEQGRRQGKARCSYYFRGSIDKLRATINLAMRDYRDVLMGKK